MLPRNFPVRSNNRRKKALQRLLKNPKDTQSYKQEVAALQNSIIPEQTARETRSKKFQG